jgi:hypothetical protein
MKVTLEWPEGVAGRGSFNKRFLQMMLNRLVVGHIRYGSPKRAEGPPKEYLKRGEAEIREYKGTGNKEYLINAANYMMLEFMEPSHPGAHHNREVGSSTRGSIR